VKRGFNGMKKDVVTIMDIDFYNTTKKDLLEQDLYPRLERGIKSFVVTANPEIVMHTRENAEYKRIVQSADFVIPDGIGIIKAANWMKQPLKERIPGVELVLDLLEYANDKELSCYFLGAKESTNEKMVEEVEKRYPGIHIAGNHHGYFDIEDETIVKDVHASAPDIVFVALGMPRQEKWIVGNMEKFDKGVFIGVGGSFDTITGEVERAPQKWIDLNLEWLYRMIQQPTRFKRILKVMEFMVRVMLRRG